MNDEYIFQKQHLFNVRSNNDAAIPSSSVTTGSVEMQMNQCFYFKGKVYSNGGNLERISIDIVNEAGERCYYQTYSAEDILAASGNLAEFDLAKVMPLETGRIIEGNYYMDDENQKSIWRINRSVRLIVSYMFIRRLF
ncbi:MAG: hypothetical protein E7335_12110 [Clostridiales bacterium]|nr:hypothetical protein [Clostridiales bacterium]